MATNVQPSVISGFFLDGDIPRVLPLSHPVFYMYIKTLCIRIYDN